LGGELAFVVVGASDTGQVREHNEDHFLVGNLEDKSTVDVAEPWQASTERGPLVIVCDGMGGVDAARSPPSSPPR